MTDISAVAIVNIVSAGGVGDPHPHSTSYACSKTALMRLTEGLAAELKPHGVKVFAVAPPAILTEMTRFIMEDPSGRRWRPGFGRALGEGRGPSPDIVADMVGRIARGEADILAGRFLPAGEGLNALLERAEEIVRDDALTLRIHR